MGNSKIEWTDKVWNPVTGCSRIFEGCQNCYARRMAYRLRGRYGYPQDDPFRVTFHPERLDEPLRWKKPSRIFICSMGDIAHANVLQHDFNLIIQTIIKTQQHTYCLLTKRPNNLLRLFRDWKSENIKNLWIGVSISINKDLWMVETLLQIPAAHYWVSVEPMLGSIQFNRVDLSFRAIRGVAWIVCGSETGPNARPINPDWARDLRDQCKNAGIPFFFKRMSGKQPIPGDLQIREYPND